MELRYLANGIPVAVRVEKSGEGYLIGIAPVEEAGQRAPNDASVHVHTARARLLRPGELSLTIDGVRRVAYVAADGPRRWVALDGQTYLFTVPQAGQRGRRGTPGGGHEALEAQMPGVVRKVLARAGDRVQRGQVLLIVEAMKMEMRISAPHVGTVERVFVAEGQSVERGQQVVELGA